MKMFKVKAHGLKVKFEINTSKKKTNNYIRRLADFAKDYLKQAVIDMDYNNTLSTADFEKTRIFFIHLDELNNRFIKTKSEKTKTQIMLDAEYEMFFTIHGMRQENLFRFEEELLRIEKGDEFENFKPIDPRLFKVLLADFYRYAYYIYSEGTLFGGFSLYWSHTLDNPDDDAIIELNRNTRIPRENTINGLVKMLPDKLRDMIENMPNIKDGHELAKEMEHFSKTVDSLYSVYNNKSPNPITRTPHPIGKDDSDERKEERKDIEESTEGIM